MAAWTSPSSRSSTSSSASCAKSSPPPPMATTTSKPSGAAVTCCAIRWTPQPLNSRLPPPPRKRQRAPRRRPFCCTAVLLEPLTARRNLERSGPGTVRAGTALQGVQRFGERCLDLGVFWFPGNVLHLSPVVDHVVKFDTLIVEPLHIAVMPRHHGRSKAAFCE